MGPENITTNHFTHNLCDHPLLSYVQLKKLALRHPSIRFNQSNISRAQNMDTIIHDCPATTSLKEALDNICKANACIVIRQIQKDKEYAPLFEQILKDVQAKTKLKKSQMKHINAWIFITSLGGITPYHRDHESTHLFHMAGEKKFYLWDHHDKEVVSQKENEYFHGVGKLKETKYRDQLMERSQLYNLTPNQGVYIPATAPHMVENGEDYAISLTLTYMSDADYKIRRIYKMNQILRKLKLNPVDANQSRIKDASKLMAHAIIRTIFFFSNTWK